MAGRKSRTDAVGRLLRASSESTRRRRLAGSIIRAAAPLLPGRPNPRDPIFVVGSPRSGTTVVFELLQRSPHVGSLPGEGHLLTEIYHPSGEPSTRGHELGPGDIRPREAKVLRWVVDHLSAGRRYLDKTPRNSLRVPYLQELFPGAWFVLVIRDGRAAVSSLINGWRSRSDLFPGSRMPGGVSVEGYGGDTWRFVIPPGWRNYARGRTLPEVCAFQWQACMEVLLQARERAGGERWVEIRYEDLVARPEEETGLLLSGLRLPETQEILHRARELDRHVAKAITPPRPEKWREENPEEIERILPVIAPTMARLGYSLRDER